MFLNLEKEIFEKSKIEFKKLRSYGFKKQGNVYIYSKNLSNGFRLDIEVSLNGVVHGKVYDLAFQEEYIGYRIEEQKGKFASQIREEVKEILLDIKKKCTLSLFFTTKQANRITNLILEKYGDFPEFLWKKYPFHGVFRNSKNQKWYALIMKIDLNKIDKISKEVEILNIKLEKETIKNLSNRKGIYEAYHMNKQNWITILLDDTISDQEIFKYVEKSYDLVKKE